MCLKSRFVILLLIVALQVGCGLRIGPGFSMTDTNYFMEPPYIITESQRYCLRWRYGQMGFFFQPSSKVIENKLLFTLQATSSSGALTGHYGEIPISRQNDIQALNNGGAFWIEKNGDEIPLKVVPGQCLTKQ